METTDQFESEKCHRLAAAMRVDASRALMPALASRLLRGADDLDRQAFLLHGWAPVFF